jgi:hypothetical protein
MDRVSSEYTFYIDGGGQSRPSGLQCARRSMLRYLHLVASTIRSDDILAGNVRIRVALRREPRVHGVTAGGAAWRRRVAS